MPTEVVYRRALANALDDIGTYIIAASTANNVASSDLLDSTANASVNRFDGRWVYAGLQQRRAQTGGFTPTGGLIVVNAAWSPPTPGTLVDITGLFPSVAQVPGEDTGYRIILNRALAKLLVPRRITVAITTAESYNLVAYAAWLDRPERLVRVMEPAVAGTRIIDSSWRGWDLVVNGGTPSLEVDTPFSVATGSLTLEVLSPATTFISGVESTTGLITDASTAIPQVEDVVTAALPEAYQVLMSRSPGRPGVDYAAKYKEAQARAEQLLYWDGAFFKPRSMAPQPSPAAAAAA